MEIEACSHRKNTKLSSFFHIGVRNLGLHLFSIRKRQINGHNVLSKRNSGRCRKLIQFRTKLYCTKTISKRVLIFSGKFYFFGHHYHVREGSGAFPVPVYFSTFILISIILSEIQV